MSVTEVLVIIGLSSMIALICFLLLKKQEKIIPTLKVGDKVNFGELDGEIMEILPGGRFIVKTEVSGMRLSKIK